MDYSTVRPFVEPQAGEKAGKLWHRRLRRTIAWRGEHRYADKQWERNVALDRGDHWDEDHKGQAASSDTPRERIVVNITGSTVRDFIAFLFKNTPEFLLKPRKREDVMPVRLLQEIVNYFWREKRWVRQARRSVQDLVKLGTGIVRVGWILELDESATPDEHGRVEYHEAVKVNEPFVRRVNPAKFLLDHTAPEQDLASARWAAEVFHRSLSDILVTERYDPAVRKKLEAGEIHPKLVSKKDDEDEVSRVLGPMTDDEELPGIECAEKLVRVFDVWDRKYMRHYLLLDGVDEPLVAENWPYPHIDGFPFVMAVFDEQNDEIYGLGLPWFMEDQQLELNRIRTGEYNHRRKFGQRRLGIQKNSMDPDELAKLQRGDDGDIFVNTSPREAIQAFDNPALPADNYKVEEIIKEDVRQLTGADALTSGGDLPSRTSATEINARGNYTGLKIQARSQVVDDFLTDITRQVIQHMKAYMDVPQAIRIQGPKGSTFAMVSREDIAADADLEITTVSAERPNREMQRQQAIQVMQHLTTNMQALQQAGVMVNFPRVMQWLLEEHFDVRQYDDFVTQGPPPMPPGEEGGGAGGGAEGGMPPGIPAAQQNAQMAAVQPGSSVMGGAMGAMMGG
jgi:hypothetical protein